MKTWRERFNKYDAENPQVYEMFKRFALEMLSKGHKRVGHGIIFGRIRYETAITTVGDPFKINENYGAYYARKFVSEHPQYADAFTFRKLWSEAA